MADAGDHEVLQEIRDTLDALLNIIEDYLFIVDETGTIINANRSATAKLGYSLDELCQMNILQLYPPERRQEAFAEVKGLLEGEVLKGLIPLYSKAGYRIPVETRICRGKWRGKNVAFGICKDISETVTANQNFYKLFQKSPAIMALSRMATQEIVDVNEVFLNVMGFLRDEIIGKNTVDLKIFAECQEELDVLQREIVTQGFVRNFEITFRDQKGGIHTGLLSADVIGEGSNLYLLIVVNDITKRRNLETDIKNQQRLLKTIIDAIPDYIFFKDTAGRYLGCNKICATKFFGKNEAEIIGKTDGDLLEDPKLSEYFRQKDLEIMGSGEPRIEENVMVVDKGFRDFETIVTPFCFENGQSGGIIGIARDITTRKNVERQLKAQHEYAEMLLTTVPSAVISVDRNQRIMSWNKWAEIITGYTAEETVGRECSRFVGGFCAGNCNLFSEAIPKPALNRTCTIKTKQGEPRFISKNFDVIRNERGEIVGGIECFSDIQERIQVEERLRESEERYSAIVNRAPEIVIIHKNEKIVFINDSGLKASGYSETEVVGHNIREFLPLHSSEIVQETVKKRLRGETVGDYEVEFLIKSGLIVNLIVKATLITYENEPAILAVLIDITERKKLEEKLKAQTSLLNGLLDSIPDIVFFKDLNGTFLGCNAETARLVGRKAEDIIGCTDYDFYDRDVADFFRENERIMLERGVPKHSEEWNHYPDGRRVLLETLKAPLRNQDSEVIGLIGVSRDITERKQLENELRNAKEAAETANSAKSRFLANMSHEIRTPMNGIIGFVELLSRTQLNGEQAEFVREIQAASDLLLQLINDVLDYSKIEADKLELENLPFNLHALIEDSVALFATQAYQKGIEINSLIAADVPQGIWGDPGRLRQVLHNLIGNAVKFTESGEIAVKLSLLENHPHSAKVRFQISDTGIGMNETVLPKLFQVFTQADASTTRKYGGTGLGLAISQRIIKMMGGEIRAESSIGQGSTFYIELNFKKWDAEEDAPLKSHPSHTGLRVLIADSYPNNRVIYRKYLEDAGYQVTEAENLEGVWANLSTDREADRPEVIILDFDLVDRRNTKQNKSFNFANLHHLPVMLLATTDIQKLDARKYLPELFQGYITKPIRRNDLLNAILSVKGQEPVTLKSNSRINPAPCQATPEISPKEFRILLVEDISANRKLAAMMLKKLGYDTDQAENGEQAVWMCHAQRYDLILMDCQMPVMDGYEASSIIKRIEGKNKDTVIVAMTANAMESDREKCIAAGMDDYLSKPVTMNKLDGMIQKWRNQAAPQPD